MRLSWTLPNNAAQQGLKPDGPGVRSTPALCHLQAVWPWTSIPVIHCWQQTNSYHVSEQQYLFCSLGQLISALLSISWCSSKAGCIIWKFLSLTCPGLDGDQSWSCWLEHFHGASPMRPRSPNMVAGIQGKVDWERDSETQRLSCQSYCLLGPSFGSHTVTSAILCWLRQSQKLLRFEVKEYKPLHSIGRGSVPHCKKE